MYVTILLLGNCETGYPVSQSEKIFYIVVVRGPVSIVGTQYCNILQS